MTHSELAQLSQMLKLKPVIVTIKQNQITLQGIWERTEINSVTANHRIILKTENGAVTIPIQNIDSLVRKL